MRPILLLLLTCALAVGAAGCGGGGSSGGSQQSFSNYETQMQALGARLGAAIEAAGNKNIGASSPAIVHNLQHVQLLLRNAAAKLAQITPPSKVAAEHQALMTGVRDYANELNGIISSVKNGGGTQALAGIFKLHGLIEIRNASQAIEKAGFAIVAP